ncbi:N2227-like protein-domain-containing protein [Dendryphion nanum]|uniref:N2227-like protein-domain-containing protein n=1 Tax=Dendryphion nanum TaxID=256645 RepID=A0A9P9E0N3_9PLEO|nr:N2227-like protein-domain-containing protein [Dendryphion nanum]
MRMLLLAVIYLLAGSGLVLGHTEVHIIEQVVAVDGSNGADPLQYGSMSDLSVRHSNENTRLQSRICRRHGSWGHGHPRFRLLNALWGYLSYEELNKVELERWRSLYKNTSKKQKKDLEKVVKYTQKLSDIEMLLKKNAELCQEIVISAMQYYEIEQKELEKHMVEQINAGRTADKISVSQTLKHFVRDWADEGTKERKDAFPCLLKIMKGLKGNATQKARVLLPGSGLSRLGHEVQKLGGFEVTVNEYSVWMNAAYRYLTSHPQLHSLFFHPFIDGLSHHRTTKDLMRKVTFPNIIPEREVLLVEGDFTTVFSHEAGSYDVLVTHFFIDTARNLLNYFETIHSLLKPGGKWVNLGPLLYGSGPFVQLSLDEIVAVIESMGFTFEKIESGDGPEHVCGEKTFEDKEIRGTEAEYGFNGKALTKNAYMAQVWVAKKN